jgi:UDP-N-acetylglucosamine diphosphorylase / glucose-1-phosphate thymidylyltransferase / UDP-N-acetylgalactosamine diphosphorylase / glucosamine-1-phosphate N-acetyltransferase / galactosamine-1-phosphate N-acetyltransferase
MFINLVFLAAGKGTRFKDDPRYSVHKTVIPVKGMPMMLQSYKNLKQLLRRDLGPDDNISPIMIVTEQLMDEYPELEAEIEKVESAPPLRIHRQKGYFNGPGLSAEPMRFFMEPEKPIFLANADQLIKGKILGPIKEAVAEGYDGVLFCFSSTEDRYSYVSVDENMVATEMIEKQVISEYASTGLCFWTKSGDFFKSIDSMKKDPTKELFISDICNYAISNGKKFKVVMVDAFIDLGTPDDLDVLDEKWEATFGN